MAKIDIFFHLLQTFLKEKGNDCVKFIATALLLKE